MACRRCDPRWVAMIACIYAAMSTGTAYVFGVYSGALSATFNFTIDQLDTITMVGSFSGVLTFTGGIITDRCGAHVAILIGGLLMSTCFVLFWMFGTLIIDARPWVVGSPQQGPLIVFSALTFFTYFSSGCITGGVFAAVVRNFPGQKGSAVGLVKGFVGICGGLYTQMYVGFFGVPDDSNKTLRFQLVIASCVAVFAVCGSPLIRVSKDPPATDETTVTNYRTMFRFLFVALLLFISTITAGGIVENSLALMIIGNGLQMLGSTETVMYIATAINGLSFGGLWPLLVVGVAEIWGKTNVGANYMFYDGFSSLLGGTVFGKFVPQAFFDKYSTDGGLTCHGTDCFFFTHLTVLGTLLIALGCSIALIVRTKHM